MAGDLLAVAPQRRGDLRPVVVAALQPAARRVGEQAAARVDDDHSAAHGSGRYLGDPLQRLRLRRADELGAVAATTSAWLRASLRTSESTRSRRLERRAARQRRSAPGSST